MANIRRLIRKQRKSTLLPSQERLFDQIVADLAARDGVSASTVLENNQKPRFIHAIERRAQERGTSSDQVWAEDLRFLRESSYPTPECFTPDEVEYFRSTGGMTAEKDIHLAQCDPCRAMIESTNPDPARVEEVLEEVRASAFSASNQSQIGLILSRIIDLVHNFGQPSGSSTRRTEQGEDSSRHDDALEHAEK
jgi:hypothetical protein